MREYTCSIKVAGYLFESIVFHLAIFVIWAFGIEYALVFLDEMDKFFEVGCGPLFVARHFKHFSVAGETRGKRRILNNWEKRTRYRRQEKDC